MINLMKLSSRFKAFIFDVKLKNFQALKKLLEAFWSFLELMESDGKLAR